MRHLSILQAGARYFPALCIGYGFLAGPILLWPAWQNYTTFFIAVFVLAVLSDIVDGMVARRLAIALFKKLFKQYCNRLTKRNALNHAYPLPAS
jgi:hypothetical protein